MMRESVIMAVKGIVVIGAIAIVVVTEGARSNPPVTSSQEGWDDQIGAHAAEMLSEGRRIFRFDTFGSERFWGEVLELHRALAGERLGGIGPGVSPRAALALGLKVDSDALPPDVVEALRQGRVDLDDPATTLALLKLNAVVGVTGFFDDKGNPRSLGIQCALCHSTVDDSLAPGIGRRLDGWPNRDLDVGAIIHLAPNRAVIADRLGVDRATLDRILLGWGPGKFDAQVLHDGKALRPDGRPGPTLIPAIWGLAGVNLHTYTGWGSVPYWNAYVANTQMRGAGTFFDPRLNDPARFPIAARTGDWNIRNETDLVTSKLAALHFYQLAIPAPKPPDGSFDKEAAARGETLFTGRARCSRCHVPPLFTEPGWSLHTAEEIGIDDFQASRSPDAFYYRTTPLRGLWARSKGGFYHDGRFATLGDVVDHYDRTFRLGLTEREKKDLIEYLKSL